MVDNAIKELEMSPEAVDDFITQVVELTFEQRNRIYQAFDAKSLTEDFKAGHLSEDEYKELMEDLKRSKKISDAADALAVRSRAVELIDNIITSAGVIL